ncbi:MAG: hypothetical protein AB7G06_07635 [Bdellovibrionales bacterium]
MTSLKNELAKRGLMILRDLAIADRTHMLDRHESELTTMIKELGISATEIACLSKVTNRHTVPSADVIQRLQQMKQSGDAEAPKQNAAPKATATATTGAAAPAKKRPAAAFT